MWQGGADIDTFIFDDQGMPILSPVDSEGESKIIRGISDEALDEKFPPTAEDAAELEAVELYVTTMASLAMLEEQEEKMRNDPAHHLPKRWEVRREQGLVRRPREATREADKIAKAHRKVDPAGEDEAIIRFDRRGHSAMAVTRTMEAKHSHAMKYPAFARASKKLNKPIQQPRK
jgi:hypothetical protein